MRTRDEKIELLRALPPFGGASRRELHALAAASDVASASAGRVLLRADRYAREAYLVIDGTVEVVVHGTVVSTLGRGEFVGELGVLDGEPRSADVVAATDVTVLAIQAATMRALVETCRTLRKALLRQVAERVRKMDLVSA